MQLIIRNSKKNYINFIEKALIFFTIITPFFLPFSRFFADFFLSLSGITLIIVAIQKKDFQIFLLKYSKIFFFWFIFLIIISTFAEIKSLAYESTLFYFRYFFYSLSILYCLINFEIFKKYFLLSISISIIILLFDSYFQLLFGINTIGYKYDNTWNRLSSFFADDYVLGSYLARIIPLFVGLIILTKLNLTIKVTVILFSTFTIFIIILFSGDRSGLLYFMLFTILFIFLLNLKIMHKLIILLISVFLILLVMISNNTIYNRMIDYTKNQILIDSKIHPFSIQHQLI